ncbi:MAG TPA: hypothetical protein VLC09_19845, partial [Polyangiaceae bacterium]|nr:hypothetical protein [Polyangiaceae bacterium]
MARAYSTLLTSPVSMADFVARLAFFAVAPFMIVGAALLFPVWGAIADVALVLSVFLFAPTVRRWSARNGLLNKVMSHALEFERFYAEKLPRPFWYYALYPLLFPYWLLNGQARREFLLFRSYTLVAVLVLLASLSWQYYRYWQPELSPLHFLPSVALALLVELLLVLALLMPIATTVVWYHASFRRRRLVAVLLVALASTSLSLWRITDRRDPIVSFSTRQRARLRSEAAPARAHDVLLHAAEIAWRSGG